MLEVTSGRNLIIFFYTLHNVDVKTISLIACQHGYVLCWQYFISCQHIYLACRHIWLKKTCKQGVVVFHICFTLSDSSPLLFIFGKGHVVFNTKNFYEVHRLFRVIWNFVCFCDLNCCVQDKNCLTVSLNFITKSWIVVSSLLVPDLDRCLASGHFIKKYSLVTYV